MLISLTPLLRTTLLWVSGFSSHGLFQSDSSLIDTQYFLSRCLPVVTGFMTAVYSYCRLYVYIMDFPLLAQTGFQEWEMDILPASCVFTMKAPDVIMATNEISSFSPYGKW